MLGSRRTSIFVHGATFRIAYLAFALSLPGAPVIAESLLVVSLETETLETVGCESQGSSQPHHRARRRQQASSFSGDDWKHVLPQVPLVQPACLPVHYPGHRLSNGNRAPLRC